MPSDFFYSVAGADDHSKSKIGSCMPDKKTLLIIDDIIAPHLLPHLADHFNDYIVMTALTGTEGIRLSEEHHPALVLLDIHLPHLNGHEVLEELKKRQIATRVIMISGVDNDVETIVRCMRGGACDFIKKPASIQYIIGRVERSLAVDTTLNLKVANSMNLVEQALANANRIEEQALGTSERIVESAKAASEKATRDFAAGKILEAKIKIIYVCVSLIAGCILFELGVASGWVVTCVLLSIAFFLLIPLERLKFFSGSYGSATAKMQLGDDTVRET